MINTEVVGYPVLVNREFMYCGLHKKGDIIKYNFSPVHRKLKESGAIVDFEEQDYEYKYIHRSSYTIGGKSYKYGDIVDVSGLSETEKEVFVKQKILNKDLKKEYVYAQKLDNQEVTNTIETNVSDIKYDIIGLNFKQLCEEYKLDVDTFCEKLNIGKAGLHLRKINDKNIESVLQAL